jgi:hypothetical protein
MLGVHNMSYIALKSVFPDRAFQWLAQLSSVVLKIVVHLALSPTAVGVQPATSSIVHNTFNSFLYWVSASGYFSMKAGYSDCFLTQNV